MGLACPAAAHFGVPKNRQQPMPCTHSSPRAQWYPGMMPVAGESPPSRSSIPCRPGTVSLPFLVPSQSISAGQPSGGDGQQLGERFHPAPLQREPPGRLGMSSHHAQPPVSPRDGFSGFQGKMPVRARGQGEKVLHEIRQSCPAQVLDSLSLG